MADNFGLRIGVEGEKESKKALAEINHSFKVLGSEMNLVASQFDKQDKSVEAITARNRVLNKESDTPKQKIGTLEQALANATASFGENDRRTQQWQIQLNNARAALNDMEKELDENNRALEEAGDHLDEAGGQADDFGDSLEESADKAENAGNRFEKLGGIAKTIGAVVAAAVVAISAATVSADVGLVKLGDEYNQAVNQISASTGYIQTISRQLGGCGGGYFCGAENHRPYGRGIAEGHGRAAYLILKSYCRLMPRQSTQIARHFGTP